MFFRIVVLILVFFSTPILALDLQSLPNRNLAKIVPIGPRTPHVCGSSYEIRVLNTIKGKAPSIIYSNKELHLNGEYLILHDPQGVCGKNYLFRVINGKLIVPMHIQLPSYFDAVVSEQGRLVSEEVFIKGLNELNEGC